MTNPEVNYSILLRLRRLAGLDPAKWRPSDNDALCRFCGIRPRQGNLCVQCEELRVRLAAKFPEVPPPTGNARETAQ